MRPSDVNACITCVDQGRITQSTGFQGVGGSHGGEESGLRTQALLTAFESGKPSKCPELNDAKWRGHSRFSSLLTSCFVSRSTGAPACSGETSMVSGEQDRWNDRARGDVSEAETSLGRGLLSSSPICLWRCQFKEKSKAVHHRGEARRTVRSWPPCGPSWRRAGWLPTP